MRIVVCVHLALALTTVSLIVQGIRATLVGRVTVESGAVIPNSKIRLVNTATGDTRDARSNGTGDFALPQLPPGDYVLTIEQAGFSTDVRRGIVLETGQEARLDIILKAGAHTQEVQEVMSARLPRWFRAKTLLLQPNVFAPAQGSNLGFRGGFNVAGNSEIANQYLLDGVDNNDEATNQPLHRPILDSVREFRVLTGTYSAEFGANLGGTATVLRAGFGTFYNHQIVGNGITPLFRNSPFRQRQTSGPFQATDRPNPADAFVGSPSVVAPGIQQNFRSAGISIRRFQALAPSTAGGPSLLSRILREGLSLPAGIRIFTDSPPASNADSRKV